MQRQSIILLFLMLQFFAGACSREQAPDNQNQNNSPIANKPSANVAANKPANTFPQNAIKDESLQKQADGFLPLFDKMPSVPIYVKDEPILKKGSETQRGVAYTTCEDKSPVIFMKKVFYDKKNQKQISNIVKHEMTHAWFCRQGIKTGHDETFRKKFKEVGGFGN